MAIFLHKSVVSPVLIGRADSLASFEHVFAHLGTAQQPIVLISGEAGIGKSRLVAEAQACVNAEQVRCLQGSCFLQDRTFFLGPLVDMLRSLLLRSAGDEYLSYCAPFASELIKILPDLAFWLPEVRPTPALEPEQEKRRLFAALTSFLLGLVVQHPVVLVLEDLHWSDESSLDFLLFLLHHRGTHPLLLLLTYRNNEVLPPLQHFLTALNRESMVMELALSALDEADVHDLVRAIFPTKRPIQHDFLHALYRLTEGNPFFVEEVLKALLANGDIFSQDGVWNRKPLSALQIPDSIADAVQQRLGVLHEEARNLLALVAVIGKQVDFSLLQAVTQHSHDDLLAVLETALAAQLLVQTADGRVVFRHALTQQVIYKGLLPPTRRALHLQIGQTLERLSASGKEAHLADLASHFYWGEAWSQAVTYGQKMGERVLALYAPRAAVEHLTYALEAAGHLPEANMSVLYRLRGQAQEQLGNFAAAQSDFEQALEAARAVQDHEASGRSVMALSMVGTMSDSPLRGQGQKYPGDFATVQDASEQAVHAARAEQNSHEEWQCLIALGMLWFARDYTCASQYIQSALALAQQLGDLQKYAISQNIFASWLTNTDQLELAITSHQQALAVFQEQGDSYRIALTFDYLAMNLTYTGDFVRATSYYDQAVQRYRTLGEKRGLSYCLALRASNASGLFFGEAIFSPQETVARCQHDVAESLEVAETIEWSGGQALAHYQTGMILAGYGLLGQALAHARLGLTNASEMDDTQWLAGCSYTTGALHLLLLEFSEAIPHLETGLTLVRTRGSAFWTGNYVATLALLYVLAGELAHAEALLVQEMSIDQKPHNVQERRLLWVWGELTLAQRKPVLALQLADQLIASAPGEDRTHSIPMLWKLRGDALCTLGRVEEAVAVLEEAVAEVHMQGALAWLWQFQRSLGRAYALGKQRLLAQRTFAAARETLATLACSLDDEQQRRHFLHAALSTLPKQPSQTPSQAAKHAFDGLSERERDIAFLVAQGKTSREIAEMLSLSPRTVDTHLGRIYVKLAIRTRAQLAAWAVDKGLVYALLP